MALIDGMARYNGTLPVQCSKCGTMFPNWGASSSMTCWGCKQAAAVAEERKACLSDVDALRDRPPPVASPGYHFGYEAALCDVEAAIRARKKE